MRLLRFLAAIIAVTLATPAAAQSVLRDAETEAFFRDISKEMILGAGLDPRNVQIILVGDPSINAFVTGGQNIFIHSGLIAAADNVNELQGVIAHEIGHIAGGHNVRFGEGAGPATNISLLSLVGAAALIAAGAGEAGMAVLGMGTAVAQGKFLSFTRDQESRADQAGAIYLSKAGLTGRGSIAFFKKLLGQEFRLAIKQENEYARTHPLSGTRIANLENVYEQDPAWNRPPDPRLNARFMRIKGKLIGFVTEPARVLQLYPETDQSVPGHYARAYAWHRSAFADQAGIEADALLRTAPADPYFLELKGQILLENGKIGDAVPVLRAAVANGSWVVTLGDSVTGSTDAIVLARGADARGAAMIRAEARGLTIVHACAAEPAGDLRAAVGDAAAIRTLPVYEARETGVAFIACGHHATERYGAPAVAAHVAAQFGLTHEFIDVENPA